MIRRPSRSETASSGAAFGEARRRSSDSGEVQETNRGPRFRPRGGEGTGLDPHPLRSCSNAIGSSITRRSAAASVLVRVRAPTPYVAASRVERVADAAG